MPISSFGYVSNRPIEPEFIVIDTRIDARHLATMLGSPASITGPDTRIGNDTRNLLITKLAS
jgi:hypothetical protein